MARMLTFVAGGHSLLADDEASVGAAGLAHRHQRPARAGFIRRDGDQLRIGALTRHRTLLESAEAGSLFPIIADAERVVADPVVRNRGTLGGSLCQADPAEDLSTVCTVLGAEAVIHGADNGPGDRHGRLPPGPV